MNKLSLIACAATLGWSTAFAATSYNDGRPSQLSLDAGDRSVSEITQELHALGYERLSDVRMSGDIYTATAYWKGEPYYLRIDDEIGAIETRFEESRTYVATRDGMSEADMSKALMTVGFTDVHKVEKHGQIYRAMAKKDGRMVDLRVDGGTGVVTTLRQRTQPSIGTVTGMSDDEIVAALEEKGFVNGSHVEREGNVISVKTMHGGQPADVNIDARNGAITVVN